MSKSKTSTFGTVARQGHDATDFYRRNIYNGVNHHNTKCSKTENKLAKTNIIYHGDSRNMKELPDESIHLMITSPPYNVGKDYDEDLSLPEYEDLLSKVLQESYRVLVEGGRACVNIANIGRKPYIPLHAYIIKIAEQCGFFMRGEIIWDKGASAGSSCAWGSWKSASNPVLRDVHEYILIFCKGAFKRYPIKHDTIGRDDFLENTKSIWKFNAASAKTFKHAAPFPVELPSRLIDLYSYSGDIVLDPFMGSGTTAEAAIRKERQYIGYEINREYIALSRERLNFLNLKQNTGQQSI